MFGHKVTQAIVALLIVQFMVLYQYINLPTEHLSESDNTFNTQLQDCYNKGSWKLNETKNQWQWETNDVNCKLDDFEANRFCTYLAGRSLLIVGDSTSEKIYEWLRKLMGNAKLVQFQDVSRNRNRYRRISICKETNEMTNVTFIRNDCLLLNPLNSYNFSQYNYMPARREKCGTNEDFFKYLSNADICLINTGAHMTNPIMGDQFLKWVIDEMLQNITNIRPTLSKKNHVVPTIIWRTSSTGHPFCQQLKTPFANRSQYLKYFEKGILDDKYKNYYWDKLIDFRSVARNQLKYWQNQHKNHLVSIKFMDVGAIGDLYGIDHADCLHYKTNIYASINIKLLYNWLQGSLSLHL